MMRQKHRIWPFKRGNSDGFTLIEVLISLAILSIVTVALLLLFNQSFDGIIKSGRKARDIYIDQKGMEEKITGDVTTSDDSFEMIFDDTKITATGKIETEGDLTFFKPNIKKEETSSDESTEGRVEGVTLNKYILELTAGHKNKGSEQLTATVTPSDATNKEVIWSSGNIYIASVNNNGLVTAIEVGTCEITAITVDGGYTATCEIKVTN